MPGTWQTEQKLFLCPLAAAFEMRGQLWLHGTGAPHLVHSSLRVERGPCGCPSLGGASSLGLAPSGKPLRRCLLPAVAGLKVESSPKLSRPDLEARWPESEGHGTGWAGGEWGCEAFPQSQCLTPKS